MKTSTLAWWLLVRGGAFMLAGALIFAAFPIDLARASDATPATEATPAAAENAELLSVEGELITLSPDGKWIAGLNDDHQVCIWDVETLTPQCATDAHPVDVVSLTWAPGSDAVAFSLDATRMFVDSDIYIVEVDTGAGTVGELQNLTDDGYEGRVLDYAEDEQLPVDIMPAWTPDGTALVFARSLVGDWIGDAGTAVYQVDRAGGEPERLFTLVGPVFTIFTPMAVLADGSIVYTYYLPGQDDRRNGIWRSTPEGRTLDLFASVVPDSRIAAPILTHISADGGQAIVVDSEILVSSGIDSDQPVMYSLSVEEGLLEPVAPQPGFFDLSPSERLRDTTPGAGEVVVAVSVSEVGDRQLMIVSDGSGLYSVRDMADPDGEPLLQFEGSLNLNALTFRTADWSEQDTVLIPLGNGDAWLLDVEE